MRCLVTGGCGFVGSNLVDELLLQGNEVTIVDNFATGQHVNNEAELIKIDIRDYKSKEKFDVIYHLAALARIQPSFSIPQQTYEVNSSGAVNILEIAKEQRCRFIYAGSSSAYFDPYANPYTYSKWLGEQHCKLYHKLYGVSCAIARFFNVYGKRQVENGPFATVMGIFERQMRNNEPLTITGTGKQRRDFCHIKDIVSGLIAISKKDWQATIFNLGSGKNYSINEIADMFGGKKEYIPARPGEADTTLANLKFTKQMLEWKPVVKLKEYIKMLQKEKMI